MKVQAGNAVDHPFGDGAGSTGAVGDPHGFTGPEAPNVERLANQGMAVRREREHAVDLFHQRCVSQRRVEFGSIAHRGGEEVVPKWNAGWHHRLVPCCAKLRRVGQDRLMPVGADQVALVILAEVHRAILVTDDRHRLPCCPRGKLGQWRGDADQVLQRLEWDRNAGHLADQRSPNPRRAEDVFGGDPSRFGHDGLDPTTSHLDAGDAGPLRESSAASRGAPGQRLARCNRPHRAITRHVNRAQDVIGAHDGNEPLDLVRADQVGFEAPGGRMPVLSLQLLPALRRGRDLQAPDLPVDRLLIDPQAPVDADRLHRELAGRARDVVLKDKTRRVGCRPARPEEGALLQHDDIRPSEAGERVRRAAPDDAGTDDDDPRPRGQALRRRHA